MNSKAVGTRIALTLVAGAVCLTFALSTSAQVQTEKTTTTEKPSISTKVASGEVVYVSGNNVVVKMDDGTIKHITVPEGAKATVDGKVIGIHDLKPGMKLQKTTTTTTTPKIITTVQTVTGKVWTVQPPLNVVLRLEDGTNQKFQIPPGQKFNVEGKMVDAWGLKKGMNVSATKVVEETATQIATHAKVTGTAPPPPQPPPQDVPILIAVVAVAPPPVAEGSAAPAKLPKTGSELPLLGLLGLLSLASSLMLRTARKCS